MKKALLRVHITQVLCVNEGLQYRHDCSKETLESILSPQKHLRQNRKQKNGIGSSGSKNQLNKENEKCVRMVTDV